MQPVREVIRAHGAKLGGLLLERSGREPNERLAALARFAESQGVANVEWVGRAELDRLAGNFEHQGAAAWAPDLRLVAAEEVLADPHALIVALDGIQDPQNFGAIVRSAVALGATAVVWPEHASAPLRPATFRASAGAVEHARLCRVESLVRFLDDARALSIQVVGLAVEAEHPLAELDLRGRTVLVVGSEHGGLGHAVRRRCSSLARLMLKGPIESLNASVACGIALHLALVQRSKSQGYRAP